MELKDFAKLLGKRGGEKTKTEHGLEHFRRMKKLSDEAKRRKKMQFDTVEANLLVDKRKPKV